MAISAKFAVAEQSRASHRRDRASAVSLCAWEASALLQTDVQGLSYLFILLRRASGP